MGDGKTTLLRALASDIAAQERLVRVESDYELALDRFRDRHHEVIALEAREANVEDVGRVTCADLVRWAMRMSADRVIVGEVLGEEIVPMLNAMNSGAAGSMCTLHANSSAEAFNKLALLAAQAPERLEFKHTFALAANDIHFTVFVRRDRGGQRVISSVREVTGATETSVITNELFGAPRLRSRGWPPPCVLESVAARPQAVAIPVPSHAEGSPGPPRSGARRRCPGCSAHPLADRRPGRAGVRVLRRRPIRRTGSTRGRHGWNGSDRHLD
jgi:hypothetical protein